MNGKKFHFYIKSLYIIISIFFFSHFLDADNLNIRIFDHINEGGYTRIVFEKNSSFSFLIGTNINDDYLVDILKGFDKKSISIHNQSEFIDSINLKTLINKSRFLLKSKHSFRIWRKFILKKPFRLVIDLRKDKKINLKKIEQKTESINHKSEIIKHKAETKKPIVIKTKSPEVINKDSIKGKISVICIDPGHGGENYGAVGRILKEKDITLKISRELKKLIIRKLKLKVVMVRNKDVDISLNRRTEIANSNNADLFISIHVNSSDKSGARGPETFFVSLEATDKESFELARKENMSFKEIEKKVETDALKMILWNMAQTDYIRDSSKLAEYIQGELNILMNTRNRGVKQAPFRVLMRASMPAVLLEIGFISNRKEEKRMSRKEFYEAAALSIFKGLKKYISK